MKFKNTLLCLLSLQFIGCSKPHEQSTTNDSPHHQEALKQDFQSKFDQEYSDLKTKDPDIYDLMEKSTCIKTESCSQEIVTAGEAADKAEQIMIFSPYSLPLSGLLTYSDRISGIYLKESQGAYKKITAQTPVSAPVHQLALMAANYPGSFPREFPTLGGFLLQHKQLSPNNEVSNHTPEMLYRTSNSFAFENLAYHNPDVNIVFVGEGLEFDSNKCTTPISNEKVLELAQKDLQKRFRNLNQIIQKHKIQSILFPQHLSTMLSDEFSIQGCSTNIDAATSEKLTMMYQKFFEKILQKNENLYIVEPTFPQPNIKCYQHSRWFQVRGFNHFESKIPKSGLVDFPEEITQTDSQFRECISFAIKSGLKKNPTSQGADLEYVDENSFVHFFEGLTTMTSYPGSKFNAAETALSMIRQTTPNIPANRKMHYLALKSFDPFLHKQFIKN
jgi:hypothetical protein